MIDTKNTPEQLEERADILRTQRADLQTKINEIDAELNEIEKQKNPTSNKKSRIIRKVTRPYVAGITAEKGGYEIPYRKEGDAREKFGEYCAKKTYRGGLALGAYLYEHHEDGTKTLMDYHPLGDTNFYPTKELKANE